MKKRLLVIAAILAMCMAMLTVSALATDYELSVGGTQVTSENASDVLEDGSVAYDASSNTLILRDRADPITGSGSDPLIWYQGSEAFTVDIQGDVTLQGQTGITSTGALTLKGEGSLSSSCTFAVDGSGTSVTIESGTYVLQPAQYAIKADTVTINGTAKVEISGWCVESGISATNKILISDDAEVTATAYYSKGLYSNGDIEINGGKVSVSVQFGGMMGSAVLAQGNIIISGDTEVEVNAKNGYAVHTPCDLTVSDGAKLTAKAAEAQRDAISAANITLSENAAVYAEAITTDGAGVAAVKAENQLTVHDSVLTASGNGPHTNPITTSTSDIANAWLENSTDFTFETPDNSVVFIGNEGQVYGNTTVPCDVEIGEGKTLEVPEGATLTIPEGTKLINNGTIINNGIIIGNIEGSPVTGDGVSTEDGSTFEVSSLEQIQQVMTESVESTTPLTISLTQNIVGDLNVPVGANVILDGGEQYTIQGLIECATSTNAGNVTNLTLQNLTMDGTNVSGGMAVASRNQGSGTPKTLTGINSLNLTMENCTVENYTKKALYLTNAKTLHVTACTFQNNAIGDMGTPNVSGDYTIDLNLCAIQGTQVSITDTTFTGDCGDKAVIKMAVRGGASDAGATDVPLASTESNAVASAESLVITGCTFSDTTPVDLNIGTDSKIDEGWTDGNFAENTTGSYAVTISGNKTDVVVNPAYLTYKGADGQYYLAKDDGNTPVENIVVPEEQTAYKSASGDLELESVTYDVKVNETAGGTVTASTDKAEAEEVVVLTVTPEKDYELDTLEVKDANEMDIQVEPAGEGKYSFKMPASNVTVDAIFVKVDEPENPCDGGENCPAYDYDDVEKDAWYHEYVDYVLENGYMIGINTEPATFAPDMELTRAQAIQTLYQMEGKPLVDFVIDYPDVEADQWFAPAVAWGTATGIVQGRDTKEFDPDGKITREELVTIIYRYVKEYKQLSVETDATIPDTYTDAGKIGFFAEDAFAWAIDKEIVNGMTATTLEPQGYATRAQLAKMIVMLCKAYPEIP